GAVAKTFGIVSLHHPHDPHRALGLSLRQKREVADFSCCKEMRRSVWASRYAGPATDARSRVECFVSHRLADELRVGIRMRTGLGRGVSARSDDSIKSTAIHDQILDHRKSLGAPRL